MRILGFPIGFALIFFVLLDTFETIIQPRRVTHRFRLARFYYRTCWDLCTKIALIFPSGKRREAYLSFFGPLSVLGLFVIWICSLIFGFALLAWSIHERIQAPETPINFFDYLYMSGTTIFTLGYGDVVPLDHFGRTLAVCESGLGFAFLAIVISYLPGINQAFSRREVTISLLDARAGSPPSAAQLLSRIGKSASMPQLDSFLAEWEAWSAELLESHLSFPILTFFRSQHDNQSWLAAITCMLDTCAVMLAELKDCNVYRRSSRLRWRTTPWSTWRWCFGSLPRRRRWTGFPKTNAAGFNKPCATRGWRFTPRGKRRKRSGNFGRCMSRSPMRWPNGSC